MILTYKYRLKGKRSLRQQRRYAWAVNQVWNFCVQTQRAIQRAWKDGLSPKWPSFYDLKDLTGAHQPPVEESRVAHGLQPDKHGTV
jgi:hypothetical protein